MIDENFATAQYSSWKDLVGFYLDTCTNLVDYFHVRPFLGLCNRVKDKKGLTFNESVAFEYLTIQKRSRLGQAPLMRASY